MYQNEILTTLVKEMKMDITFHETPEAAVKGCQFVYAGSSGRGVVPFDAIGNWTLTREIMAGAEADARVLLGTSPMNAIPIESEVLGSKNAMLLLQAENRLRVYKRMLHWLFES